MNPLRGGPPHPFRGLVAILASTAVVACSERSPAGPGDRPTPNFIRLQSDVGDYIGAGQNYDYTQANAIISVAGTGGRLSVSVTGDQGWRGDFMSPTANPFLQPGKYEGLARYPFNDPAKGGVDWFGEGRTCNTLTGSFTIDSARYDVTTLMAIDLSFEQHCEGLEPALRGSIHWNAADTTRPPGPVYPIPANLWEPAPGDIPTTGNYIVLKSDTSDWVGGGQTYTYTPATPATTVAVRVTDGAMTVQVTGAEWWYGYFVAMSSEPKLRVGYYGDLHRYGFSNPVIGGLLWWGEARGCDTLQGWFTVDNVTYQGDNLTSIDLRFEQHCEGAAPALHGAIHWVR